MKTFNVSRASLREALRMLDAMGYVEIAQRKRTRVKSLVPKEFVEPIVSLLKNDLKSVKEVIEVRKCMETWSAFYAAERRTPGDIERLHGNLEGMADKIARKKSLIESDAEFHMIISTMTHNKIQSHLMFSIYDTIRNTVGVCYEKNEADEILEEHRKVYVSIKAGDPEMAKQAMADHLDRVQDRVDAFSQKNKAEL